VTPGLLFALTPGLPLGLTPGLPLGLLSGFPLARTLVIPFALVASPKLGLRQSGFHPVIWERVTKRKTWSSKVRTYRAPKFLVDPLEGPSMRQCKSGWNLGHDLDF